jgi:hypothetical protein
LDITFLFALAATGVAALAGGYAIGLRLTVKALIVWSFLAGAAILVTALGLGAGALASIIHAAIALALLQAGYFVAVLTKPEPAEEATGEQAQPKRIRP